MSLVHTAASSRKYVPGDIDVGPGQLGGTVFVISQVTTLVQDTDFEGRYYYRYVINPATSIEFQLAPVDTPLIRGYSCYVYNYSTNQLLTVKDTGGANTIITLNPNEVVKVTLQDSSSTGWFAWTVEYITGGIPVNISYLDTEYGTAPGLLDRYDAPYSSLATLSGAVSAGDVVSIRRNTTITFTSQLASNVNFHSEGLTVLNRPFADIFGSNALTTGYATLGAGSFGGTANGTDSFLEAHALNSVTTITGGTNYIYADGTDVSTISITGGTTYMISYRSRRIEVLGANVVELFLHVLESSTTVICFNPNATVNIIGGVLADVTMIDGNLNMIAESARTLSLGGSGVINIAMVGSPSTTTIVISGNGERNISYIKEFLVTINISGGINNILAVNGVSSAIISGGTNYFDMGYFNSPAFRFSGGVNYIQVNDILISSTGNAFSCLSGSTEANIICNRAWGGAGFTRLFYITSTGTATIRARVNYTNMSNVIELNGTAGSTTHNFNIFVGTLNCTTAVVLSGGIGLATKNYLRFNHFVNGRIIDSNCVGDIQMIIVGRYVQATNPLAINVLGTNTGAGSVYEFDISKMGQNGLYIGGTYFAASDSSLRMYTREAYLGTISLLPVATRTMNVLLCGRFATLAFGAIVSFVLSGAGNDFNNVIFKTCSLISDRMGGPLAYTGPGVLIPIQLQGDLIDKYAIDLTRFAPLGSVEVTSTSLN